MAMHMGGAAVREYGTCYVAKPEREQIRHSIRVSRSSASYTVLIPLTSGKLPANVVVHYHDEDVIVQRLSLDNYATSAESEVGSWALLASSGPSVRARQEARCPCARGAAVDAAPAAHAASDGCDSHVA